MRFILALLTLTAFSSLALAAPEAEPWPYWEKHASNSEKTIDHAEFTQFLQKYVVEDKSLNRVRYGAVSDADKKRLKSYIESLEAIKISEYDRDQQRPFWLNLYNAVTLDVVLDHYPVKSIRKIGGGLFGSGPWDEKLVQVEDKELSLNDIEHRILRPIWPDPLNHYGVNCASVGCPNLRKQAYTADNFIQALRANAKDYINSPRGTKFEDQELEASNIYEWYAADFGNSEQAIVSHLRQYAAPGLSAKLDAAQGIGDYYYDWSLNDAKSTK